MKESNKKPKNVAKGAPSGFIISLAVHAGAFLLAGMLVVFSVVNKEEKNFVPPKPVQRPKMDLKKPQVKVKKNTKPKASARIVTKVKSASMPDIQLPEMSGIGNSLAGGGLGAGFSLTENVEVASLFGGAQTIGNDFVGTFIDFKKDRQGKQITMDPDTMMKHVRNFLVKDWKPSVLSRFYHSPNKLYATCFVIPTNHSTGGPEGFGEDTEGYCWMVHYKGQLAYKEDITFRFCGNGDDILIVRVDGEVVLSACWPTSLEPLLSQVWMSSSPDNRKWALDSQRAVVGDWITLKAGEHKQMEVLIGEVSGGLFAAELLVQVEGEEYPRNPFMNGPTLPIFKTEELSRTLREDIENMLFEGDASLTNGPVFRDY